jgi:hypothetical protein
MPTAFCYPLEEVPPVPHLVNTVSITMENEVELRDNRVVCFDEAEFRTSKMDKDKEKVWLNWAGWG